MNNMNVIKFLPLILSTSVFAEPSDISLKWEHQLEREDGTKMKINEIKQFDIFVKGPGDKLFLPKLKVLQKNQTVPKYSVIFKPPVAGEYSFKGTTEDTNGLISVYSNTVVKHSLENPKAKPKTFKLEISATVVLTPID